MKITHVIPHVGWTVIDLYPPADSFYQWMRKRGEERRLQQLRHLGMLSETLSGARQARWDYVMAMLYFIQAVRKLRGLNSKFSIGSVRFSSAVASLQMVALAWNIGHLPGTFTVEKAVCRVAKTLDPSNPADVFAWPQAEELADSDIREAANECLRHRDYLGLARVLGVLKLLRWCQSDSGGWYEVIRDFLAPFMLEYNSSPSGQWEKLRDVFSIARHLAYLTLDSPLTGFRWGPDIPSLVSHLTEDDRLRSPSELYDILGDLLSPIERMTYDTLYHRAESRQHIAIASTYIADRLRRENLTSRVDSWLEGSLKRDLKIGKIPSGSSFHSIASIRLRTPFMADLDPSGLEAELRSKGFSHPCVLRYRSWSSDLLLEPDEFIVDLFNSQPPKPHDIGRFVLWMIERFDDLDAKPDNFEALALKTDLARSFVGLISTVVDLRWSTWSVEFVPWPLANFGLFPEHSVAGRCGIWTSSARIDSPIVKHIVRERSKKIPRRLRARYGEVVGLRETRNWLRHKHRKSRCRWLVLTGSLRFTENGRNVIEFDGGFVKISSRSGQMTWFGVETKKGKGNPHKSLSRRLKAIGIDVPIHSLSSSHAVAQIPL